MRKHLLKFRWLVLLFALGVTIGVVFFSLTAQAQQDQYCQLLNGQTRTVPVSEGENLNEGSFQFNLNLSIDQEYRSCAEMVFLSAIGAEAELDGWVWNSNLGWTAMKATGNAAPYGNSGVDFSSYPFRSFVKYASANAGQLRGWWWNDAAGWISLHCLDLQAGCGASSYGGTVDGAGNVTGFAWSDRMGWIDLTGIRLPTADDLTLLPDVSVELIPVSSASSDSPRQTNSPILAADSNLGYQVAVKFDFEGTSLLDDFDFDFELDFRDQTLREQVTDSGSSFSINSLPNDRGNNSNSIVPGKTDVKARFTGGRQENGFTEGGTDNYRKTTINGDTLYLSRKAILSNIPTVSYTEDGGLLAVKDMDGYKAKKLSNGQVYQVNQTVNLDVALTFLPPVITGLSQGGLGQLSLNLGPNIAVELAIDRLGILRNATNVKFGLAFVEPDNSDYYFCLIEDEENLDECELPEDDNNLPKGYASKQFNIANNNYASVADEVLPYIQSDSQSLSNFEIADDTGMYAYVQYQLSGQNYSFMSGNLLSSLFQVFDAEVKGNTRLDAFKTLTEDGSTLPSVGERANRLKESYLKYAQAVTRGRNVAPGVENSCNPGDSRTAVDLSRCELVGDADSSRRVFMVQTEADDHGTPVVLNLNNDQETKEYVVVVIGKDVVIEDDFKFENENGVLDRDKKLTLLVFKNGNGAGGNVYVRGETNVLQANIFADGSLFSVGSSDTWTYSSANRVPQRTSDMRAELRNQFVMLGSLVSQNTIGGCDLNPPRLGDGRIVASSSIEAKEEACLYDLNYFRYSPMVYSQPNDRLEWPLGEQFTLAWEVFKAADGTVQQAKEAMRQAVIRPAVNQNNKFAIVNFVYVPPATDPKLPELPSGFTFSN